MRRPFLLHRWEDQGACVCTGGTSQLQAKPYLALGATIWKEDRWHSRWAHAVLFMNGETANQLMRRFSCFCALRGRTLPIRVESHVRGISNRDTFCRIQVPLSLIFVAQSFVDGMYCSSSVYDCRMRSPMRGRHFVVSVKMECMSELAPTNDDYTMDVH